MTLKDVIAYCLVISLGLILAVHFALFWIYGGVFIYENNKVVLVLETVMSIAILCFGLERLIHSTNGIHDRENVEYLSDQDYKQQFPERSIPLNQLPSGNQTTPHDAGATAIPEIQIPVLSVSTDYVEDNRFQISNSQSTIRGRSN
jgi:hypothetical protein